jgi:formylglycine-generating enzyme required for sulfatase activity
MGTDHRSRLSFVIALSIILGSAWIGVWRAERPLQVSREPLFAAQNADGDRILPEPTVSGPEATDEEIEDAPVDLAAPVASSAEPRVDVTAERLGELLAAMRKRANQGQLLEPADTGAFALAAEVLESDPQNEAALAVWERAVDELVNAGRPTLPEDLLPLAQRALALASEERADLPRVVALRSSVERTEAMLTEIVRGERLLAREGASAQTFERAVERFRNALKIDSSSPRALRGMEDAQRLMIERALAVSLELRFDLATQLLEQADAVQPGSSRVLDARSQLMAFRAQTEAEQLTRFKDAVAANDADAADQVLETLRRLIAHPEQIADLESKVVNLRLYGGYAPGERFTDVLSDGSRGPRMVVVPVGRFRMGSPESEPGRGSSEGPQRLLAFDKGFAVARNEITVAEFRRFIEAEGYRTDAERSGSSAIYNEKSGRLTKRRGVDWRRSYNGTRARDGDPVVHVSWNDAAAYAAWLSKATGKPYRLPTEAEFEYVLRAGGSSIFPWGEGDPAETIANLAGSDELSETGRRWSQGIKGYNDGHWGPAPVRSYAANAFGLYDLEGNLSEWVEDCWHDNFLRAPEGTEAWVNPGCELRVIRGGSWGSSRDQCRSAWRGSALADSSGARVGFRVARSL